MKYSKLRSLTPPQFEEVTTEELARYLRSLQTVGRRPDHVRRSQTPFPEMLGWLESSA